MLDNVNRTEVIVPSAREKIDRIVDDEMFIYDSMGLSQFRILFPPDAQILALEANENTRHLLTVYHKDPEKFFIQLLELAPTIARVDGKFKHRKKKSINDHYFSRYYQHDGQDYFDIVHLSGVYLTRGKGSPEEHINKNANAILHGLVQGMFKLLLLDTGNNNMVELIYSCVTSPTKKS